MRYFVFFIIAVVFLSCTNEVDLTLPTHEKRITLNCILNTSSDSIVAFISYSKPILEATNFESISDATVILYEEEKPVGQFVKSDSTAFVLPYTVKPGKRYKIEIVKNDNKVWAETIVPLSVKVNFAAIENNHGSLDYKASFKDNHEEENYYWISAKGFSTYNGKNYPEIAGALYSNYSYADDFNRLTEKGYGYVYEYNFYIRLADSYLPDDSVTCQFYPSGIHIMDGPQEIVVLTVDYHLDKYMKSSLLMNNIDSYAEDVPIVYTPFPVYSNVNGGTGILGSLNIVSKVFTKD